MRASSHIGRFLVLALCSFAVVILVVSPSTRRLANQWNPGFWESLYVRATYETYDTAVRAVKASDTVVLGRILAVTKSREVVAIPEWGVDGILTFATVSFQVDRVLAGEPGLPASGLMSWEAFVPTPGGVEQMQASVPTEPHILLLAHPKGSTDGFILLNPESYFVNDQGTARAAVGAEQPWSKHWEGRSFQALVEEIDRAG